MGLERLLFLQEQSDLGLDCNFFGEASLYEQERQLHTVVLAKVTQLRVFNVYANV